MLLGLPLLGVQMNGQALETYLEFPPLTHYVAHAGFSWPVFIALALGIAAVVAPFVLKVSGVRCQVSGVTGLWCFARHGRHSMNDALRAKKHEGVPTGTSSPPETRNLKPETLNHPSSFLLHPFPLWGWLGVTTGLLAWVLAWTRFPWFAPLQPFTFSPLWFSYILVINALTFRRTGRCMMLDRTGRFLLLFPLSAGFWWFFEYLNRFVQNWSYEGVGALTPGQYFLYATLPFATVLPAVLGTREFLRTFPRLTAGLDRFAPIRVRRPDRIAVAALALSAIGLAWIGVLPDYLFPLLWISPLVIILSLQTLAGRSTLLAPLRSGDWRDVCLLALSALICGFFWELWNYLSLAKWIYAVPFVNRFHVFEMPLLGYSGYLPFGLECGAIGSLIMKEKEA